MIINQFRNYLIDCTVSDVYVNGMKFGEALEDEGRPAGVKIQDETCIPEGVYKVAITRSNRFQKDMMVLYNVEDDHSVKRDGVRFTGIRVHRGSTIEHTAGCVLMANYEILQDMVQQALDAQEPVFWVITRGVETNVS